MKIKINKDEIIKESNIKNEKEIKYQINKNNINFNGENLNEKKWNGKGKEYCLNGELYFEGEYLNGERNGKGKEYYLNVKLEFEGEYLNGNRFYFSKIDYI